MSDGEPSLVQQIEALRTRQDEDRETILDLKNTIQKQQKVVDALSIPGATNDSTKLKDLELGNIPLGLAIQSKVAESEIEDILREYVDDNGKVDVPDVDREKVLPIHAMWLDLRAGRTSSIRSANARRAARVFQEFVRRASGEESSFVSVTNSHYTADSTEVKTLLVDADDITDSGVSKTVGRVMKALQRYTQRIDCECSNIGECPHGLIKFDDSRGTNRIRVPKSALHTYIEQIDGVEPTDDDAEQASEDLTADTTSVEAQVDAQLDTMAGAEPARDSDTVVSILESEASDQPLQFTD